MTLMAAITLISFVFIGLIIGALMRIRRCPSDKILVVYGKVGNNPDGTPRTAKCIHGGTVFVWPLIQDYQWLDLTPVPITINLRQALSRQNIRVDVPSVFTVAVATAPNVMANAAERLLGLTSTDVVSLSEEIILGQLRAVIATMDIEEINADRDKFVSAIELAVETELNKIGLRLINVNIQDINDESGYIEALGKKAAAEAIEQAKVDVALQVKLGETGRAQQDQERRVAVAAAEADAVTGENSAKVAVAHSDASRDTAMAEARRKGEVATRVQRAQGEAEAYAAEARAEEARAERETAQQRAEEIVRARIAKEKVEIAAQAEAARQREIAQGEADAIFAKREAQARGQFEMLAKTAEGLRSIVSAAGGDADKAVQLILANQVEPLTGLVTDAVKALRPDKVVVWDGGGDGSGTAGFVKGLFGAVPPLKDVYESVGLRMPVVEDQPQEDRT